MYKKRKKAHDFFIEINKTIESERYYAEAYLDQLEEYLMQIKPLLFTDFMQVAIYILLKIIMILRGSMPDIEAIHKSIDLTKFVDRIEYAAIKTMV